MKKVCNMYFHRNLIIMKEFGGWTVEGDLNLYKTLMDAKNAIDKRHDSSHKAEPRIIRQLTYKDFEGDAAE